MVVRIHRTLAERTALYAPGGHAPVDVNWRTGAYTYRDHDGSAPRPGDQPNRQGVHVVRRGRLVRLHDILPESEKPYFDADDVVEEAPTSAPAIVRHADDSTIPGLVGFITEAQRRAEAKKERAADKRKSKAGKRIAAAERRTEREKGLSQLDRATAENRRQRFGDIIREQNADVSDLRTNGFAWKGGHMADRYYPAFTEYFGRDVQRTDLHPMMKFFWSTIPQDCRVGVDKTFVEKCHSKQLAGNFPYIEGSPFHCRWIFREIDGAVFESYETCYAALQKIFEVDKAFADEGIDMMPNLVMGDTRADGSFEAGHLIWMFKPGSSVWTFLPGEGMLNGEVVKGGDERCRTKPIERLKRTSDSLCQLLLPIGGDPGQTNFRKPKNPIAPFTTVLITNENNLFELSDFPKIKNYPLKTSKAAMYRDAEIYRAKTESVSETLSMERWNKCKAIAGAVARRGRMNCEPKFLAAQATSIANDNPTTLALWVEAEMRDRVESAGLEPGPGLERVIKKQATFAAGLYMKKKVGRGRKAAVRGRDREFVVKLTKLPSLPVSTDLPIAARVTNERRVKRCIQKARRKEAGRESARINASRTLWRFKENVYTWFSTGGANDLATFLKEGLWSVCKDTAKKYWTQVSAEFSRSNENGAKRYIACPTSGQRVLPQTVRIGLRTTDAGAFGVTHSLQQFDSDNPHPVDPSSGEATARRSDPPWLQHAGYPMSLLRADFLAVASLPA